MTSTTTRTKVDEGSICDDVDNSNETVASDMRTSLS